MAVVGAVRSIRGRFAETRSPAQIPKLRGRGHVRSTLLTLASTGTLAPYAHLSYSWETQRESTV